MFPAWKEAEVIGPAVAKLLATLDCSRFEIFIGVYPNDPDTGREVDKLVAKFPNITKVVTSAPGPTCKADCLNHIIRAIRAREAESGVEFVGCIMQDAEDIVHPAALRLFNWLCPAYDLVQTPVFSLRRRWWELTAGHSMEEFAEAHARELPFRQHFAGIVPGCGVGTCYSRRALSLAESTGETFSNASLTEDYEFSLRMRDAGLRMVFARVAIPRRVPRQGWLKAWWPTRRVRDRVEQALAANQTQAAVQEIRTYLAADPEHLGQRWRLAQILVERGEWEAAAGEACQVLARTGLGEAHLLLGEMALRQRRLPEAATRLLFGLALRL